MGLPPYLVRAIADHEREMALLRLSRAPLRKAGAGLCRRAAHTTLFRARLARYFDEDRQHLAALEQWEYACLLISAHGDPAAGWYRELMLILDKAFGEIKPPQCTASTAPTTTDHFAPHCLAADLKALLAVSRAEGRDAGTAQDAEPFNALVNSVYARRSLLDQAYAAIQAQVLSNPSAVVVDGAERSEVAAPGLAG
jgi:hypothetical protein